MASKTFISTRESNSLGADVETAKGLSDKAKASRVRQEKSKEVSIRGLNLSIGQKVLLENAWLKLCPDHQYGLIGANGCGKTTLLRFIAAGKVQGFPSSLETVLVEQEAPAIEETPLQVALFSHTCGIILMLSLLF